MKTKTTISKIGLDLYLNQMKWTLWFFAFALVLNAVSLFGTSGEAHDPILFAYRPTKTYLLIIGIVAATSFLTFYVKSGVTRKKYFWGTLSAALGLTLTITLVLTAATLLLQAFPGLNGAGFQSSQYLLFQESSIHAIMTAWINLLTFYLAGWLISAGFYRYKGVVRMGFIILAIVTIGITDYLWQYELRGLIDRVIHWDPSVLPGYASFLASAVLLGLVLWIIRGVTARTPVKLK
ncbi:MULTISPECIES: hypothetical protein [Paenibacillus]|uniref:hypothetical protein n=1 Tax=Paenibacillus TaxID=44249 RepID=UPI002FE23EEA